MVAEGHLGYFMGSDGASWMHHVGIDGLEERNVRMWVSRCIARVCLI